MNQVKNVYRMLVATNKKLSADNKRTESEIIKLKSDRAKDVKTEEVEDEITQEERGKAGFNIGLGIGTAAIEGFNPNLKALLPMIEAKTELAIVQKAIAEARKTATEGSK